MGGEERFELDKDKNTFLIGRSVQCDVAFKSQFLSRKHCEIRRVPPYNRFIIKNLTGTNGTYLDNVHLKNTDEHEIENGAIIGLGVPLIYANDEGFANPAYVFLKIVITESRRPTDPDCTLEFIDGASGYPEQSNQVDVSVFQRQLFIPGRNVSSKDNTPSLQSAAVKREPNVLPASVASAADVHSLPHSSQHIPTKKTFDKQTSQETNQNLFARTIKIENNRTTDDSKQLEEINSEGLRTKHQAETKSLEAVHANLPNVLDNAGSNCVPINNDGISSSHKIDTCYQNDDSDEEIFIIEEEDVIQEKAIEESKDLKSRVKKSCAVDVSELANSNSVKLKNLSSLKSKNNLKSVLKIPDSIDLTKSMNTDKKQCNIESENFKETKIDQLGELENKVKVASLNCLSKKRISEDTDVESVRKSKKITLKIEKTEQSSIYEKCLPSTSGMNLKMSSDMNDKKMNEEYSESDSDESVINSRKSNKRMTISSDSDTDDSLYKVSQKRSKMVVDSSESDSDVLALKKSSVLPTEIPRAKSKRKCIVNVKKLDKKYLNGLAKGKSIKVDCNDRPVETSPPHSNANLISTTTVKLDEKEKDLAWAMLSESFNDNFEDNFNDELPDLLVKDSNSKYDSDKFKMSHSIESRRMSFENDNNAKSNGIENRKKSFESHNNLKSNIIENKRKLYKSHNKEKLDIIEDKIKSVENRFNNANSNGIEKRRKSVDNDHYAEDLTKHVKDDNIKVKNTLDNYVSLSNSLKLEDHKRTLSNISSSTTKTFVTTEPQNSLTNDKKSHKENINISISPPVEQVEKNFNDDEVEEEIFPSFKILRQKADLQKIIAEDEIPVNQKLNFEMFEDDDMLCSIKQEPLEIKQEPLSEDINEVAKEDGIDEDDDDCDEDDVCVVANYSQMDDIIWVESSDEEIEDSHKETKTKEPDFNYENLPSPDYDLDIFLKEFEDEDEGEGSKVPEVDIKNIKKEDDAWSVRLSQKFDMKENEENSGKTDQSHSKNATSSSNVILVDDDDEEDPWWPEASQSFLEEDDMLTDELTVKKQSNEKDSPILHKEVCRSVDSEKSEVKSLHQNDKQKEIAKVSIEPLHDNKRTKVNEKEASESSENDDDEQWWPELSQNFDDDSPAEEKSLPQNKVLEKQGNWYNKNNDRSKRLTVLIEPKAPPPRTKGGNLRVKGIKPFLPVQDSGKKDGFKVPISPMAATSSKSTKKIDSKKPAKKGSKLRVDLSKKLLCTSTNTVTTEKRKHHLVSKDVQSVTPPKVVPPKNDDNISIIKRPKPSVSGENPQETRKTTGVKVSSRRKLTEINLFASDPLPKNKTKVDKKSSKMQDLFGDNKDGLHSKPSTSKDKESHSNESTQKTKKDDQNRGSSAMDIESTISSMEAPPSMKSKPRTSHQVSKKCEKPKDKSQTTDREQIPPEAEISNEPNVTVTKTKSSGILKIPGMKKAKHKKKTHFPSQIDELVKIRYIEPRDKSDKVGPLEARAREIMPAQEYIVDKYYHAYFIFSICKWNYDWLDTYRLEHEKIEKSGKNRPVTPPPVTINKGLPTLVLYNSYKDYKLIFSNLMYLEIWESLYKDWLKSRNYNTFSPFQVDKVSDNPVQYEGKTLKFNIIVFNTVLTKEQFVRNQHARIGSLVCIKVKQGTKTSNCFGYVDYISKKRRRANKELEDLIPNGEGCLSIVVKTTKTNESIKSGAIVSICNVYYLRPSVRTWEGLVKLPTSPLCQNIMRPSENVFSCDVTPQAYFIHSMPLNESQKDAVVKVATKCTNNPHISKLSLIHGPPGTGKTRTIAALIAQISSGGTNKCRILLCAPSNAAVDELTRRLVRLREIGISILVVRTGMKDKTSADIKEHTLDHLVQMAVRKELTTPKNASLRNELSRHKILVDEATKEFQKAVEDKVSKEARRPLEQRLHELSRKKKDFENSCLIKPTPEERYRLVNQYQDMILMEAQVITATLAGCRSGPMEMFMKRQNSFTCCIIDEAGQCCETETWLPLLLGINKLVLVGDHKQLPATVLSQTAQGKNLHQSLFERLHHRMAIELQKTDKIHFLGEQYRMHPEIANWPSRHFYQGHLTTFRGMDKERACHFKPYVIFDLKRSKEEGGHRTGGMHNPTEALFVRLLLESIESQLKGFSVGVITPYQAQKQQLEGKLASLMGKIKLDINTIDAFQGQERDMIVLSFVRANNNNSIGFLSQRQRLNVALTRARRCCILVANLASLKGNKDWQSLITDAQQRGRIIALENNVTAYNHNDIKIMMQN